MMSRAAAWPRVDVFVLMKRRPIPIGRHDEHYAGMACLAQIRFRKPRR
jgi:hypothetical protein